MSLNRAIMVLDLIRSNNKDVKLPHKEIISLINQLKSIIKNNNEAKAEKRIGNLIKNYIEHIFALYADPSSEYPPEIQKTIYAIFTDTLLVLKEANLGYNIEDIFVNILEQLYKKYCFKFKKMVPHDLFKLEVSKVKSESTEDTGIEFAIQNYDLKEIKEISKIICVRKFPHELIKKANWYIEKSGYYDQSILIKKYIDFLLEQNIKINEDKQINLLSTAVKVNNTKFVGYLLSKKVDPYRVPPSCLEEKDCEDVFPVYYAYELSPICTILSLCKFNQLTLSKPTFSENGERIGFEKEHIANAMLRIFLEHGVDPDLIHPIRFKNEVKQVSFRSFLADSIDDLSKNGSKKQSPILENYKSLQAQLDEYTKNSKKTKILILGGFFKSSGRETALHAIAKNPIFEKNLVPLIFDFAGLPTKKI